MIVMSKQHVTISLDHIPALVTLDTMGTDGHLVQVGKRFVLLMLSVVLSVSIISFSFI